MSAPFLDPANGRPNAVAPNQSLQLPGRPLHGRCRVQVTMSGVWRIGVAGPQLSSTVSEHLTDRVLDAQVHSGTSPSFQDRSQTGVGPPLLESLLFAVCSWRVPHRPNLFHSPMARRYVVPGHAASSSSLHGSHLLCPGLRLGALLASGAHPRSSALSARGRAPLLSSLRLRTRSLASTHKLSGVWNRLPKCSLTNRCSCRAARCAADAVCPVQCLLFVRVGVAGPQLSSTVRQRRGNTAHSYGPGSITTPRVEPGSWRDSRRPLAPHQEPLLSHSVGCLCRHHRTRRDLDSHARWKLLDTSRHRYFRNGGCCHPRIALRAFTRPSPHRARRVRRAGACRPWHIHGMGRCSPWKRGRSDVFWVSHLGHHATHRGYGA